MTEHESEDNYIKRVLAMSPDELRAHAEAEGVETPDMPDLVTSLRNLRFRLEGALAYHVDQGNREEMAWLGDGVIALSAAIVQIAPAPGIEAEGRDPQGLGATPESPPALGGAPQSLPLPQDKEAAPDA